MFSIPYNKNFQYLKEIDEVIFHYNKNEGAILKYAQENPNQTIVAEMVSTKIEEDKIPFTSLPLLKNMKLLISEEQASYYQGLPHFFITQAKDWSTLIHLLTLNPTDIYVSEALGFEMVQVAEVLHSFGIKVRCFPDVGQSAYGSEADEITKFFIRPEDIELYSNYVDVFEFWSSRNEPTKMNTLYNIYAIQKEWKDDLFFLLSSFHQEVNNESILPNFAETRLKCGKRCIKTPKDKTPACQVCQRCVELSNLLGKNGLKVVRPD